MEAVSVLFRPRWLALHAFTLLVVVASAGAAWWQFTVAKDGSGRSLGYALQWPAIGLFGLGVWAWLCRDGIRAVREESSEDLAEEGAPMWTTEVPDAEPEVDPEADPELAAYNAMLARLAEKAALTEKDGR